jgi:hypothetical protein
MRRVAGSRRPPMDVEENPRAAVLDNAGEQAQALAGLA